ncbi:uncharacterized protein LOC132295597 [Cornus florida]|uniref:uncharacterized protein LOC132295597 n=1 Tax=Cornus florida TaxID=4283 RepID=UPI00289A1AB7|nr:uncharacterized protein LOC132295597 [Cornus florida]
MDRRSGNQSENDGRSGIATDQDVGLDVEGQKQEKNQGSAISQNMEIGTPSVTQSENDSRSVIATEEAASYSKEASKKVVNRLNSRFEEVRAQWKNRDDGCPQILVDQWLRVLRKLKSYDQNRKLFPVADNVTTSEVLTALFEVYLEFKDAVVGTDGYYVRRDVKRQLDFIIELNETEQRKVKEEKERWSSNLHVLRDRRSLILFLFLSLHIQPHVLEIVSTDNVTTSEVLTALFEVYLEFKDAVVGTDGYYVRRDVKRQLDFIIELNETGQRKVKEEKERLDREIDKLTKWISKHEQKKFTPLKPKLKLKTRRMTGRLEEGCGTDERMVDEENKAERMVDEGERMVDEENKAERMVDEENEAVMLINRRFKELCATCGNDPDPAFLNFLVKNWIEVIRIIALEHKKKNKGVSFENIIPTVLPENSDATIIVEVVEQSIAQWKSKLPDGLEMVTQDSVSRYILFLRKIKFLIQSQEKQVHQPLLGHEESMSMSLDVDKKLKISIMNRRNELEKLWKSQTESGERDRRSMCELDTMLSEFKEKENTKEPASFLKLIGNKIFRWHSNQSNKHIIDELLRLHPMSNPQLLPGLPKEGPVPGLPKEEPVPGLPKEEPQHHTEEKQLDRFAQLPEYDDKVIFIGKPGTVFACPGNVAKKSIFDAMECSRSQPFILPHFADLNLVHHTLNQWVTEKSIIWKKSKSAHKNETLLEKKQSWWTFLEKEFKELFRTVAGALVTMYCHDTYHGDLDNNVMVSEQGDFQLVIMRFENAPSHPEGIAKDIVSLKNMMKKIIGFPFEITEITDDSDFKDILPKPLLKYMELLDPSNIKRGENGLFLVDPAFLLDSSFLWTASERVQFIEVFSELVSSKTIDDSFQDFFYMGMWHENLPGDSRLAEVLGHMRETYDWVQKKKRQQQEKGQKVAIGSSSNIKNRSKNNKILGADNSSVVGGNSKGGEGSTSSVVGGNSKGGEGSTSSVVGGSSEGGEGSFVTSLSEYLTIFRFFDNYLKHRNDPFWAKGQYGKMLEEKKIEPELSKVFPELYERLRESICKWLLHADFKNDSKRIAIQRSLRRNIPRKDMKKLRCRRVSINFLMKTVARRLRGMPLSHPRGDND